MKIINHFTDGTTRESTAGVRVPYTVDTATAYRTLAAAQTDRREEDQRKAQLPA